MGKMQLIPIVQVLNAELQRLFSMGKVQSRVLTTSFAKVSLWFSLGKVLKFFIVKVVPKSFSKGKVQMIPIVQVQVVEVQLLFSMGKVRTRVLMTAIV